MFGVLVVDDNEVFRQLVVEMLHDFPTLEVQEASSGREALQKFEDQRPDLMFVDLELGDENGFTTIEKVRSQDKDVRIAVLTSFDLPEYKELAERYDVDYFLTKGVSTQDDICEVVNSVLGESTGRKSVFGLGRELLGFIEEAVVHRESGKIVFAIMSFSFLDMPNMLFPVPGQALSLNDKNQLILQVAKEKLRHGPGFERDERPDFRDRQLVEKIYRYYGYKPFWQEDEENQFTSMAFEEEVFCQSQGSC